MIILTFKISKYGPFRGGRSVTATGVMVTNDLLYWEPQRRAMRKLNPAGQRGKIVSDWIFLN